uniref:Small ribosomal subunit protein uS9c n=1 Tax=Chlamydomonas leiostraca TaxID=1034604 RepID=A0A1L2M586_9CHLO|nr:ribosomal protein S9 [Chlamydomonas leiostraca]APD80629.1 ribosomal protein S9 [Chlamydomonas leiostraca]
MEILARGVGRRKEAVAQVQLVKGTGQFIINNIPAQQYLHNNTCSLLSVKAPLTTLSTSGEAAPDGVAASANGTQPQKGGYATSENSEVTKMENLNLESMDTIVKVKGGGLVGQAEAIKLGLARALCELSTSTITEQVSDEIRKQLKDKGYLTQDSRVKERRKYGLKKARKASQYHKR